MPPFASPYHGYLAQYSPLGLHLAAGAVCLILIASMALSAASSIRRVNGRIEGLTRNLADVAAVLDLRADGGFLYAHRLDAGERTVIGLKDNLESLGELLDAALVDLKDVTDKSYANAGDSAALRGEHAALLNQLADLIGGSAALRKQHAELKGRVEALNADLGIVGTGNTLLIANVEAAVKQLAGSCETGRADLARIGADVQDLRLTAAGSADLWALRGRVERLTQRFEAPTPGQGACVFNDERFAVSPCAAPPAAKRCDGDGCVGR